MEEVELLATISQIHYLYDRILTGLLASHQRPRINAAQARLLMNLWEQDGINIQELAERTCLKKTTLSTMLPRLVAEGMITVSHDSADQRARVIRLTKEARDLKTSHQKLFEVLDEITFSGIEDKDKQTLVRALLKVRENLVEREQEKRGSKLDGRTP